MVTRHTWRSREGSLYAPKREGLFWTLVRRCASKIVVVERLHLTRQRCLTETQSGAANLRARGGWVCEIRGAGRARRRAASLADAGAVLGPRPAAVARELTKRFEEVRRADLATLAAHYATAGPPKGEIVVVIGGADAAAGVASAEEVDAKLTLKLADASLRDAVRQVTAESGWTRADVYARALALRDGDG